MKMNIIMKFYNKVYRVSLLVVSLIYRFARLYNRTRLFHILLFNKSYFEFKPIPYRTSRNYWKHSIYYCLVFLQDYILCLNQNIVFNTVIYAKRFH